VFLADMPRVHDVAQDVEGIDQAAPYLRRQDPLVLKFQDTAAQDEEVTGEVAAVNR